MERRPRQGRTGQGKIQWLVVVVVAARETVRLTWLVLLTVDSLSSVDLTSQGFLYITAYACVHLCVDACMCAPKKKRRRRSLCVCVKSSRLGDVTKRKQICPLSFSLGLVITPLRLCCLVHHESPHHQPQLQPVVCLRLTDVPPSIPDLLLSYLKPHTDSYTPPVCLFCCLWQGHAHYSTFSWLQATTTFSLHLNLTSLISLSCMRDPVVSIFCPFCLTYDLKNLLILEALGWRKAQVKCYQIANRYWRCARL